MTMDAISKEEFLESILLLKTESKQYDIPKHDLSTSPDSPTLLVDTLSNAVVSLSEDSLPSFTDLSLPDRDIISPFLSEDEFEENFVNNQTSITSKELNLSNTSNLFDLLEASLILISECQYRMLAIITRKKSKFLYQVMPWMNLTNFIYNYGDISKKIIYKSNMKLLVYPQLTIQILLPYTTVQINYKFSKCKILFSNIYYDNRLLMPIPCESKFPTFIKSRTDPLSVADRSKQCLHQGMHSLLETLTCHSFNISNLLLGNSERLHIVLSNNYIIEMFEIIEQNFNYLSPGIIVNIYTNVATSHLLQVFRGLVQKAAFPDLLNAKKDKQMKTKQHACKNRKSLVKNEFPHAIHDNYITVNQEPPSNLIGKAVKNPSQTSLVGLMKSSQSFLSQCAIHNKHLDYLFGKLFDNIIQILKTKTKGYLLLKCEILLANKYKKVSRDFSELSLSSQSSKDKAFYQACRKSETIRNTRLKIMKNDIINSQLKGRSVDRKFSSSLVSIQPIKNSTEKLNMEYGKPRLNIFTSMKLKQNNSYELKNDRKIKIENQNSNFGFRSVSAASTCSRSVRNRKSSSVDQTIAPSKHDLSKRIEVFLKEYASGKLRNNKQANKNTQVPYRSNQSIAETNSFRESLPRVTPYYKKSALKHRNLSNSHLNKFHKVSIKLPEPKDQLNSNSYGIMENTI